MLPLPRERGIPLRLDSRTPLVEFTGTGAGGALGLSLILLPATQETRLLDHLPNSVVLSSMET